MKVCIAGPSERRETMQLQEAAAKKISSAGYEVVNYEKSGSGHRLRYGSLEDVAESDVLVARIGTYDDAMWAAIGVARAANIPIVPLWNEAWPLTKCYGFTKDIKDRNMQLVRPKGDKRSWPSTKKNGDADIAGVVKDLKYLEQNLPEKNKRPEPSEANFELPPYIVGDSRNWDNQDAYYKIEDWFLREGIHVISPPRSLDGYHPDRFPEKIEMPPDFDGVEECVLNAGPRSSMTIGRVHMRNLMGSRFEEGVAWWNMHPGLHLDGYVFPGRESPYKKYEEGKNPGMHLKSIFDQNLNVWGITNSVGRLPSELAPIIKRLREAQRIRKAQEKSKKKPERRAG